MSFDDSINGRDHRAQLDEEDATALKDLPPRDVSPGDGEGVRANNGDAAELSSDLIGGVKYPNITLKPGPLA